MDSKVYNKSFKLRKKSRPLIISRKFTGPHIQLYDQYILGSKGYNSTMFNHPICEGFLMIIFIFIFIEKFE